MADQKISELSNAGALDGSESVEVVKAGANVKTTTQDIADLGGGGGTWGSITGTLSAQTDLNTALGLKAPLASPTFTGTPAAPTPSADDNDTSIATTAYVQTELRALRVVTGTGASVQADDNKLLIFNSATPFNFTLDQLTADSKINYVNIGAGAVTLVNGSGVTLSGVSTVAAAVSTNYPAGLIIYHTATTPRNVTATFDQDLIDIAALSPANDDVLQRKAGVWTNRTMLQLAVDLGLNFNAVCVVPVLTEVAGQTYNNQPNTEQYLNGSGAYRKQFDASYFIEMRVTALVSVGSASANSPRMYPQYTSDLTGASGWTTIGAGTTASGDAISLTSTGEKTTNWITLPAGALTGNLLFRTAFHGGDGAADPQLHSILMHFRT